MVDQSSKEVSNDNHDNFASIQITSNTLSEITQNTIDGHVLVYAVFQMGHKSRKRLRLSAHGLYDNDVYVNAF